MSRDMERRPYESRRGEPQRGEYRSHGGHPTILYVRNISDKVRYEDLKHLFQKYGKLIDVTIPLDYYSGYPKGYCFIEYEDPRDAEEAHYRMARQRLFGREIEVEFARGNRKTAGEMRNRESRSDALPPHYGGRGGPRGGGDFRPRTEYRGDSRADHYRGDERRERKRERSRSRSNSRADSGHRNRGTEHKKPVASYSRSRSRSRSCSRNRSGSNQNESPVSNGRKNERSRSPQDRSRSRSNPMSSSNRDMGSRSP